MIELIIQVKMLQKIKINKNKIAKKIKFTKLKVDMHIRYSNSSVFRPYYYTLDAEDFL